MYSMCMNVYKLFVHSRCSPDEAIFNRNLADVRVVMQLNMELLFQLRELFIKYSILLD